MNSIHKWGVLYFIIVFESFKFLRLECVTELRRYVLIVVFCWLYILVPLKRKLHVVVNCGWCHTNQSVSKRLVTCCQGRLSFLDREFLKPTLKSQGSFVSGKWILVLVLDVEEESLLLLRTRNRATSFRFGPSLIIIWIGVWGICWGTGKELVRLDLRMVLQVLLIDWIENSLTSSAKIWGTGNLLFCSTRSSFFLTTKLLPLAETFWGLYLGDFFENFMFWMRFSGSQEGLRTKRPRLFWGLSCHFLLN